MNTEKKIKKKEKELLKIYKDLPAEKYSIAVELIKRCAFLSVTLEELETEITENGITETYRNGENQQGIKQSTAVKTYNMLTARYSAIIGKLTDLIPKHIDIKPAKLIELKSAIENDTAINE